MKAKYNCQTLVSIRYNKKFQFWEALTAAGVNGKKLQKFGNDYNITGATFEECKGKAIKKLYNEDQPIIFVGARPEIEFWDGHNAHF